MKLDIKQELQAEFLERIQEVMDAMRHEKTFISASMCVHPVEQNRYLLFEVWADREEFFSVQMNREYRRALSARTSELINTPPLIEEWSELRADYAVHLRR